MGVGRGRARAALVAVVGVLATVAGLLSAVAPASAEPVGWLSIEERTLTTCGIRVDHTGWCWGDNDLGQLGVGDTTDRSAPVRLPGLWSSLTPGWTTCGVRTDGSGWCWGANGHGQVGDGTTVRRLRPFRLPGAWTALKAAQGFSSSTCGIRVNRTGWCWGQNDVGQLGVGDVRPHRRPVQVSGLWRSLDPELTTCGVRPDRSGWCWGYNHHGMIGDGTTTDRWRPVRVPGSWRHLVQAELTTCGITTGGAAYCWGFNGYGQVGNGTDDWEVLTPFRLPGSGWASVRTRRETTCGVRWDGSGWCWGDNFFRQTGAGPGAEALALAPVRLPGTDWASVSPGTTSCGLRGDGTLWCWGYGDEGMVGDGGPLPGEESHRVPVPVQVPGDTWSRFASGLAVACAIRVDETGWCWGSGGEGSIGDGASVSRFVPTQVL